MVPAAPREVRQIAEVDEDVLGVAPSLTLTGKRGEPPPQLVAETTSADSSVRFATGWPLRSSKLMKLYGVTPSETSVAFPSAIVAPY